MTMDDVTIEPPLALPWDADRETLGNQDLLPSGDPAGHLSTGH